MTSAGTSVEYPHMATAAPHVKLLRQLASAKDDYLSGAFDISWDGAKATLYLVFGRPSHAVFDTDQEQIEGEAAIDALLSALPRTFVVSDWRRAMSPQETLSITIDELAGPFVRLAGSYADDPVTDTTPEWWSADDSSPDLAFGLADFPLLPGGRPLWEATSPEDVNLGERLADLPPSILILTGAKLRAAAVVSGGDLIDAVWIDADDQARGEAAGMAILGATKGSLAGYALDDPRVAEALTMLWRLPLAVAGIELSWLDAASLLAAFHADGLDRVLLIDAPVRGVALFSRGGLVAVYSETQRSAVGSPERLRSLLSQARGRLTVMERKPRPLTADAPDTPPSATEFFGVAAPEPSLDGETGAEPEGSIAADGSGAADGAVLPEEFAVEPASEQDAGQLEVAPGPDPDATGETAEPLPPPLPSETGLVAAADAPAPLAENGITSEPAPKRHWWAFGRSRRNRDASPPPDAAEPVASDGNGVTSFGWSVRQSVEPAAEVVEAADDPSPQEAPEAQVAHDFWSEFATPDPDADTDEAVAEAQVPVDSEAYGLAGTEPDHDEQQTLAGTEPEEVQPADAEEPPIAEERRDPDQTPVLPEGLEPFRRRSSERTVAPWSWPLAEAESAPPPSTPSPASPFHLTDEDIPAAVSAEPATPERDRGPDEGFFQRDEPVGSQFVDFDEVRKELVRIGVVWLGESSAVPVTALLSQTRSTIDDFVATIDTIRGLNVEGQDPASIQAMAREMHQQAAERLCGA
jgi:hypothetical protein